MSAIITVHTVPRIETERLLMFDSFPKQPQTFEDGFDYTSTTGSTAGEELDQRPSKSVSIQSSTKVLVLAPERVRRGLVYLERH